MTFIELLDKHSDGVFVLILATLGLIGWVYLIRRTTS